MNQSRNQQHALPHLHRRRAPLAMLAAALLALLAAPGIAAAAGNVFTDPPKTYPVTTGWFDGRATFYYDFGGNSPAINDAAAVAPAPIYVFVTGFDAQGKPQPVAGQHNIIDDVPGDADYSDLWQVNFVTVPSDYVANTVTSLDAIQKAGYPIKQSDMMVDCPVVPLGSKLAEGTPGLTQGWYKGREVDYFDFGASPAHTEPIYALITGMDAQGNPQFVAGQHNIIGVIPGQADYTPFWDVHLVQVPAGYKANTITSVAQVMASGYPMLHPGLVVNCPVIRTDAEPAMGTMPGMPSTGAGPSADVWLGAGLAGLLLLAGLALRRAPRRA